MTHPISHGLISYLVIGWFKIFCWFCSMSSLRVRLIWFCFTRGIPLCIGLRFGFENRERQRMDNLIIGVVVTSHNGWFLELVVEVTGGRRRNDILLSNGWEILPLKGISFYGCSSSSHNILRLPLIYIFLLDQIALIRIIVIINVVTRFGLIVEGLFDWEVMALFKLRNLDNLFISLLLYRICSLSHNELLCVFL